MEDKSNIESSKSSFCSLNESSFDDTAKSLLKNILNNSKKLSPHSSKDKCEYLSSPKSPMYRNLINEKDKILRSLSINQIRKNLKKRDTKEVTQMLDKLTLNLDENEISENYNISIILRKWQYGKMLKSPKKELSPKKINKVKNFEAKKSQGSQGYFDRRRDFHKI